MNNVILIGLFMKESFYTSGDKVPQISELSTTQERFEVAGYAYHRLASQESALVENPGEMAQRIVEETGLDFSTAAAVALSAPSLDR